MADNWQPIETAPKDGTRFLAFDGNIMAVCRMENISTSQPLFVCRVPEWDHENYDHPNFTHWMPSPAPPTQE